MTSAPKHPKYDIEQNIGFLLAKAYRRGFAMFRDRLAGYGITPPQFSLLAFLWKQDGLSQTELSEKSQIDRATMVGLVDRMEKLGLVKRERHASDRRAWRICLTEKGRALEDELSSIAAEVTGQLTSKLGEREVRELEKILQKIRR
jgi:MarR family transcriptional regulator, lower aerobic nicotinate degradation pathway regulator